MADIKNLVGEDILVRPTLRVAVDPLDRTCCSTDCDYHRKQIGMNRCELFLARLARKDDHENNRVLDVRASLCMAREYNEA